MKYYTTRSIKIDIWSGKDFLDSIRNLLIDKKYYEISVRYRTQKYVLCRSKVT